MRDACAPLYALPVSERDIVLITLLRQADPLSISASIARLIALTIQVVDNNKKIIRQQLHARHRKPYRHIIERWSPSMLRSGHYKTNSKTQSFELLALVRHTVGQIFNEGEINDAILKVQRYISTIIKDSNGALSMIVMIDTVDLLLSVANVEMPGKEAHNRLDRVGKH